MCAYDAPRCFPGCCPTGLRALSLLCMLHDHTFLLHKQRKCVLILNCEQLFTSKYTAELLPKFIAYFKVYTIKLSKIYSRICRRCLRCMLTKLERRKEWPIAERPDEFTLLPEYFWLPWGFTKNPNGCYQAWKRLQRYLYDNPWSSLTPSSV